MKTKPLTKKHYEEWDNAINYVANLESDIEDRIQYIIEVWVKAFGGQLSNWYFYGAEEGEVGKLQGHIGHDTVHSIHIDCNPFPKGNDKYGAMVIKTKDDGEWGWDGSFPVRWLFEDFEDEIINGKVLFEKQDAEKKVKKKLSAAAKKELNDKLVAQAKLKLSKEELQALKKAL